MGCFSFGLLALSFVCSGLKAIVGFSASLTTTITTLVTSKAACMIACVMFCFGAISGNFQSVLSETFSFSTNYFALLETSFLLLLRPCNVTYIQG